MEQGQLKTLIKSCLKILLKEGFLGLNKKQLDDILRIRYIQGITDEEIEKVMQDNKRLLFSLVKKQYPWMLEYQYPTKREGSIGGWYAPIAQFFYHDYPNEDYLHNFCREIIEQISEHNTFKQYAKTSTFDEDMHAVYDYAAELMQRSPKNALYDRNYPLWVSLYTVTSEYGGPEEGGWNYNHSQYIKSLPANNFQQARSNALKLLKDPETSSKYSNGTVIYLEKRQGSVQTNERPRYS